MATAADGDDTVEFDVEGTTATIRQGVRERSEGAGGDGVPVPVSIVATESLAQLVVG